MCATSTNISIHIYTPFRVALQPNLRHGFMKHETSQICLKSRRLPGWRRISLCELGPASLDPCSMGSGEADSKALYSHTKSFHAKLWRCIQMLSICHSRQKYKNSSVFKYREKRLMMIKSRGRADTEYTFPKNSHSANWGSLRVTRKGSLINGQQNGVTILETSWICCRMLTVTRTDRQDWCFLESQGFWHPSDCVPATASLNGSLPWFIGSQPATTIAYYEPPTTTLHSGTMDEENRPLVTDEPVESER